MNPISSPVFVEHIAVLPGGRPEPGTLTADNQMKRKSNLALNAEMKAVAERLTLPAVLAFHSTAIE